MDICQGLVDICQVWLISAKVKRIKQVKVDICRFDGYMLGFGEYLSGLGGYLSRFGKLLSVVTV